VLTALALAFVGFAVVMALRRGGSPRGAFDAGREHLRTDAHKPTKVATVYVVVAAFFALTIVTGAADWMAALFAFAVASAFLTCVLWVARR